MATTLADRMRSAELTASLAKSRTALANLLARRGIEKPTKGDLWQKAKDCGADRLAKARAFLRDSNAIAAQYQRQAFNVSNKYFGQSDPYYDDAVSEALHGIVLAARKFETDRGVQFGTYATVAAQRRLWEFRESINKNGFGYLNGARPLVGSLEDDFQYEDPDTEQPDESIMYVELKAMVEALPRRERYVFKERLNGTTLEVIGKAIGLSKERARQISTMAKQRLQRMLTENGQLSGCA